MAVSILEERQPVCRRLQPKAGRVRSLVIECLLSCGWWLVQHITLTLKLDSVDGRLGRSRSQSIGCVGGFLQEFELVTDLILGD